MTEIEVGSMAVLGVYQDVGLHTGLAQTGKDLKDNQQDSKNLKEEMVRLNKVVAIIGATAALAGTKMLSMFKNAVSSSPYLIGALTKIKTYMELLGWAITKHLKPSLDWLADKIKDLYDWYTNLSDTSQTLIMWTVLLGAGFLTLAGSVVVLAFALNTLGFSGLLVALKGIVTWFGALITGVVSSAAFVLALGVALGLVQGLLTVMALDKLGILDWISGLGEGFRNIREEGSLFADVLTVLLGPLALLGDLFLVMVTDKTMEDFWNDVDTVTDSLRNLWDAVNVLNKPAFGWLKDRLGFAVGTVAVPSDGMYKLHAGERVVPANSNQGNTSNESSIILDFGGANISLASGIDLDKFADTVSRKIADTQAWGSY